MQALKFSVKVITKIQTAASRDEIMLKIEPKPPIATTAAQMTASSLIQISPAPSICNSRIANLYSLFTVYMPFKQHISNLDATAEMV